MRTLQTKYLDWPLIWNRRHFEKTITVYAEHYNTAHPYRAINLGAAAAKSEPALTSPAETRRIDRVDVLGGLIREYSGRDLTLPPSPAAAPEPAEETATVDPTVRRSRAAIGRAANHFAQPARTPNAPGPRCHTTADLAATRYASAVLCSCVDERVTSLTTNVDSTGALSGIYITAVTI